MRHSFAAKMSFLLLTLFLLTGATTYQAAAQTPPPCTGIQFGSFSKGLSYIVAQRQGFFTAEGITVCYRQVTSSTQQFNDLFAGNYQIIQTAGDNIVNRVINSQAPVSIITNVDKAPAFGLAANSARGINSIADLRGKPIMVDAPDSGFVFALRKILADNGLFYPQDYSFQIVGGSAARFAALNAGQLPNGDPVYATMLAQPQTLNLTAPVYVLAEFADYVSPYQNIVYATSHSYSAANPDKLIAFSRAYIKAQAFVLNPANRDVVLGHAQAELGITREVAEKIYNALANRDNGENLLGRYERKATQAVIELRQEFGGFTAPLSKKQIKEYLKPKANGLYDDRFWKAAIQSIVTHDHEAEDEDED
jgi:ABC-type nitrate/sulfonate/bicarbonate transport system substrate-binding protein